MTMNEAFALERLSTFGPFFTLRSGSLDSNLGWRRVSDCLNDVDDDDHLVAQLIDEVGVRLVKNGSVPPTKRWIAASVLHLGWAARLTSVYAGSMALRAQVPDLAASSLYIRPLGSGRFEFGVESPTAQPVDRAWSRLSDGHLGPLASTIQRHIRIGRRLFDGNTASALAEAVETLAREQRVPLATLANQPWARPESTRGFGGWRSGPSGFRYIRNTCCGYEQLPTGSPCRDCGLRKHAGRGG
jgi:hypothetical protein